MTAWVAILFAAMLLSLVCTCRLVEQGSRWMSSLSSMNRQVAASSVAIYTALLPTQPIGALTYDSRYPSFLPPVIGAEA